MTQAEFIALAPRVSFGAGLLFWAPAVEITALDDGGVRVRTTKKILDRACVALDISDHTEANAAGKFMGVIGGDYFVTATQLARMHESSAIARLLFFVRDSMFHEVDEWIRWDGKIVNDPHAEDEAAS